MVDTSMVETVQGRFAATSVFFESGRCVMRASSPRHALPACSQEDDQDGGVPEIEIRPDSGHTRAKHLVSAN